MNVVKTSMSFSDVELAAITVSLLTEQQNAGERWDEARADGHESADYWREKYELLGRLHRRVVSARRRLERKARDAQA